MYRPEPWAVPTPDGQRPVTVQTNVHIDADADASDQGALMAAAQVIVSANMTRIQRELNNRRMQVAISGQPFASAAATLDGMTIRWSLNNGYEKLVMDVYPSGGGGEQRNTETNLDGYICWIHADPGYPDVIVSGFPQSPKPAFPGPYNIFFNGYLIEQNYQPLGPIGGYPILFGKTALLCDSYVGSAADGHKNPLLDEGFKLPNPVLPPNGWGDYKGAAGPDQATYQQTIPKTLGYWIFDWLNNNNPWQYLEQSFGGPYANWALLTRSTMGNTRPQFTKGLYFKSSQDKKSPLKPKGMNGFSVNLSPQAKGAEEVVIAEIFVGEFYDRGKYRTASQSWTYGAAPGLSINVNDSPLIYGTGLYSGGFAVGGGMKFNLDPEVTKTFSGTNMNNDDDFTLSLMGPHDGIVLEAPDNNLDGLNDDQIGQYKAWEAQVQAAGTAYESQIAAQLAALQPKIIAAYALYQNAYKAAILGRYIQADTMAYEKYFDDYMVLYAPPDSGLPPVTYSQKVQDDKTALVTQTIEIDTKDEPPVITQTYGPMQQYYLDLTPDLNTFIINLNNPYQLAEKPQYMIVPGSQYSTTTGGQQPDGTVLPTTTVSGQEYAPDHNYPFLAPGDEDDFIGPAQPSQLLVEIQAYVSKYVPKYQDLLKQYQAIENQIPPNAPTIPNFGDDYTQFGYSNISISGDSWSYEQ